ncbi:hypothetical protein BRADI_3g55675v3 [Brachypodium distachyon]|uniref:Hydrophobic seed protein domain-containing protein n=1 Tax=Brachypodium distachyon TaxID=15368 RepID=A0A0Q3FTG9_BRADI|nr:hypothetical protein BRADI_3g55675v3 [Brachypodium distachyon]
MSEDHGNKLAGDHQDGSWRQAEDWVLNWTRVETGGDLATEMGPAIELRAPWRGEAQPCGDRHALVLNVVFFFTFSDACGCHCDGSCPRPGGGGGGGCGGGPSGGGGGRGGQCPIDALKLGVCARVVNGLINLELETPTKKTCCALIQGLLDMEAVMCLCTALRAHILGIHPVLRAYILCINLKFSTCPSTSLS